jgi:hypothetical protein
MRNAKITSTMLGVEDHGIFTFMLMLDFGDSGQGYGGYALDSWSEPVKRRIGTAFGCEAIMRVLAVLEVASWEKLPGTFVRVEGGGLLNGTIDRIGHPLKDKWIDMREMARSGGLTP